jgi:hypothetical protein
MKNAHLRFGWLTYVKSTEKTTTSIKLRLDRFIGEVLPDPPRQAKAHLISVIGGDTQVGAISAAISLGDRFMVEGPGVQPIRVCLERNTCRLRPFSLPPATETQAHRQQDPRRKRQRPPHRETNPIVPQGRLPSSRCI